MRILLILLLFPVMCWGQKKDTVFIDTKNSVFETEGGGWTYPYNSRNGLTITPKQDTIPVIMLVCDTSIGAHSLQLWFSEQGKASNEGRLCWWQFGYEVYVDSSGAYDLTIIGVSQSHYILKGYIDKYKNPLPKNILVWMTKEIK
jgi:hypothetical protein